MQWKTKSPRSNSCEHVRSFKSAGPWHVPNNFFQRFFDHTSFPLSLSISFCLSRFHTLRADPQINCATTSFAQVLEPIGSLCMIMGLAPRVSLLWLEQGFILDDRCNNSFSRVSYINATIIYNYGSCRKQGEVSPPLSNTAHSIGFFLCSTLIIRVC